GDRVRRERSMNPKCQTRPGFDTFSAKSAHLTGLKMRRITRAVSFNHLVGASEQRRGHGETKHPGRLGVNNQFKLRRLHDWQVRRLGAFKNGASVGTELTIGIRQARSVADKPAGFDKATKRICRWDRMSRSQ